MKHILTQFFVLSILSILLSSCQGDQNGSNGPTEVTDVEAQGAEVNNDLLRDYETFLYYVGMNYQTQDETEDNYDAETWDDERQALEAELDELQIKILNEDISRHIQVLYGLDALPSPGKLTPGFDVEV